MLVVRNLAAFTERHGPGLPVAGEYSGKLDNSGERLKLSYGAGQAIYDFVYPTVSGAITRVSPDTWRPTSVISGTPGTTDTTPYRGGDVITYALASPQIMLSPETPYTLTFAPNPTADQAEITLQSSPDLMTWTSHPDATRTATGLSLPAPAQDQPLYLRLEITIR